MLAALAFAVGTVVFPFDSSTLDRADVRACFERVLKAGGYGHLPLEAAAFLVRDGDVLECRMWPREVHYHSHVWRGRVPDNTVAIVHSHPADQPEPSANDTDIARSLQIPLFVVTPRGVTRTPAADPVNF